MIINTNKSKILTGIEGEHVVASMFTRLGFICSLTQKNTKNIDMLITKGVGQKVFQVQVKTALKSGKSWRLDRKNEDIYGKNFYYVFCNLNTDKSGIPSFYIVQSKIVSKYISQSHKKYISEPGLRVKKRKDTAMRVFSDDSEKYLLQNGNIDRLLNI